MTEVRTGLAVRTLTTRAVFFDGSEDSWTAIEALGTDNCSMSEHGFVYQWGHGTAIPVDSWVTLDEQGVPVWEDFTVAES